MNEREKMVAVCGIDCGICPMYLALSDEKLRRDLAAKAGIPEAYIGCKGCRQTGGKCLSLRGQTCATYVCAQENRVDLCCDCGQFPCPKLNPAVDRAGLLPHNCKVYNLCYIKHHSIARFVEQSAGIQDRYYNGKFAVGRGPILEDQP